MITLLKKEKIKKAKKLVDSIFRIKSPLENLYFFAYKNRNKKWLQLFFPLFGFKTIDDAWIYTSPENDICGIIGFYAMRKDHTDSRWLSWFCVSPKYRGQGIGKKLLDYAIQKAKTRGYHYLKLYTGTDKMEREAQVLYESRGLKEIRRVRRVGYYKLYRELDLTQVLTEQ